MARHVFFSFHFDRDHWRVNQVRNSWVVKGKREAQPFLDSAGWEKVKREGNKAIKNWIDSKLSGKSVTVVLIGAQTYTRSWVKYEVNESHRLGKGMLGIFVHRMKDNKQQSDLFAVNPFDLWTFRERNPFASLTWGAMPMMVQRKYSSKYPVYDWVREDGRANINSWIEAAAKAAGR
jgi:MTH538 TIR-like domain (DUF1863)